MPDAPELEAERLLNKYGIVAGQKPFPVDPIRICRYVGIKVYDDDLSDDVSGMLVVEPARDPVITLNRKDSPNRARFTCAHELGHWVTLAGDEVSYKKVDRRDPLSSLGMDPDEVFANQFAAALLMPADEIKKRWDPGASLAELALEFRVSADAMRYRLRNLGLL